VVNSQEGGTAPTLTPLEFEARVGVIQPRSVAWSPVFPGKGGGFSVLAVGSKGGRVWLWRYHLTKISSEPPFNSEAANLELVSNSS